MAMIALARPTPISMQMLTAAIKRRFPGFKGGIMPVGGDGPDDASGNTHMLLIGNSRLVLMSIDAPMPPGHLNSSIAAAELIWPDARGNWKRTRLISSSPRWAPPKASPRSPARRAT